MNKKKLLMAILLTTVILMPLLLMVLINDQINKAYASLGYVIGLYVGTTVMEIAIAYNRKHKEVS